MRCNNLYRWAMSQKLPVNKFEWIEGTYQFNEDFIKNCVKESYEGYFLEVMFIILKNYELDKNLRFLPGRMKIEKVIT